MMRFLRKGDCYALNKPLIKYSDSSLYGFRCLMLSFLGKFYYQFSCNVQKSRARGTTGDAFKLKRASTHGLHFLKAVYEQQRHMLDTYLTHERHNNNTCLTHERHMNGTTKCVKKGDKGKKPAVMKRSWSMASVMSFNTLLIHCYYFTHTWLILRPYTKSASARVAGWFGVASRLGRTLVHICSTGVRLLFECCSSAVRVRLEAQSKASRRAPEGLSNKCRSRLEAQSKDCRRALEGLSNKCRTRLEELVNRLLRFTCKEGKVENDLYINRLILRWFGSICGGVRGEVGSMLVKNKRSSQNSLNEANGFLLDKERADDIKKPMVYGLQVIAIFCVLFNFASVVEAKAQELRQGGATGIGEIKPLEIGDTIPEEIWNMPLQVVEYGGKTKEIRLADYRGKVIILDYWATWCGSCILSMPKMHKLVDAYPDDVALINVTHEGTELISKFVAKTASPQIRELGDNFFSVVEDKVLNELLPHQGLPHIAIFNTEGVLEHITNPMALNQDVIGGMVNKQEYYLPKYRDKLDTTLLSLTFSDIKYERPAYYTSVLGYLDGFMLPSGERIDSLSKVKHGFYINYPILRLLSIASQSEFSVMMPNRRVMLLDNPSKLEFHHLRNSSYNWNIYDYTYEYVLPLSYNKEQVLKRMYNDLSELSGFYAEKVRLSMPCLIVKDGDHETKRSLQSKNNVVLVLNEIVEDRSIPQKVGLSADGAKNYFKNTSVNNIVYFLNNLKSGAVPFLIDESSIDYSIDFDLPDDLTDIDALQKCFVNQGLQLELEEREIDMFVVSDGRINTSDLVNAPLELTKFGYVLKEGDQNE
ncbi:TlpA disulfide reductase family protein [Sphingobacterium sp. UT-1RO-CII-1]|uniref:TlpA family protein disulfide reductase n=1 Tax=Sphingobacterium sp. UT-1RO-CII-1 TaxID=2995225 RepID=UPI00227C10CF|nr:TlpA disulfide reductase family protein [Sphingobacterium sp. UT-1RO-CII-1]MCY4779362.1 TlpA disulfide reductase family protein [Sphingobacterium sp. UT-1RO-CII-1]